MGKEIWEEAEAVRTESGGQTALDARMRDMFMIRNPMEVEKPKKELGVRRIDSGLAGVTVDQDVSVLNGEWKVTILARGGDDAERHASDKLEPFAVGSLKMMEKGKAIKYPVTQDLDLYGRAWTFGPVPAPQFWGDKKFQELADALDKAENKEDTDKASQAIEKYKRERFPILWRHYSAPSVFPVFGDDGELLKVYAFRKMKAREIKARWGLPEEFAKTKGGTDIEILETADREKVQVVLGGKEHKKVLEWEHDMGRVPWAFFGGKEAPENSYGIVWRGALFHLEEVIQAMDETITDIRTSLRDQVSNARFVKLNVKEREQAEGWPTGNLDLSKDMNLLIGEEVGQVETAQIRNDAYQLIDRLKIIADQVGVRRDPLIGSGPSGESAVRLNVSNQAAKSELKQEQSGLERGAVQVVELLFESVKALSKQFPKSPDKVFVRVADTKNKSKDIGVTPDDVDKWEPMVDVTIPNNLPVDQTGLSQNASILTGGDRPLLSHRTVRQRDLGVSNPSEEQDRIDEEQDQETLKPLFRMYLLAQLKGELGAGDIPMDELMGMAEELGPGFGAVFQEILGAGGQPVDRSVSTAGTNAGRTGRGQGLSDVELGGQTP